MSAQRKAVFRTYWMVGGIIGLIGMAILGITLVFPENLGFTRSIIYFESNSNQPGYYLIDDEITAQPYEYAECFFYGLGDLTVTERSALWIRNNQLLNLTVLTDNVEIIPIQGKLFQYEQNWTTNGIKLRPTQPGSARILSLLIPANTSQETQVLNIQPLAEITSTEYRSWQMEWREDSTIGHQDIIIIPTKCGISKSVLIEYKGIFTETHRCIIRMREGIVQEVVSYGTSLQIPGYAFNSANPDTLKEFKTHRYPAEKERVFSRNSTLFGDEHLALTQSSPLPSIQLPHPYLYLNASTAESLRNRIRANQNGSIAGPWAGWYNTIQSPEISPIADTALRAYLEQNSTWMNITIDRLLDIADKEPFRQNLERGSQVVDYIIAYDLVYNNMTAEQRAQFETDAASLTYPSADAYIHDVMPDNNHRIVSLVAYGMLGLVTNNATQVALMQEAIDRYCNRYIRSDGCLFEGFSYEQYTFNYGTRFMFALKNAGGYNYFHDPKYIHLLNFTTMTRAPDGYHPCYEDSAPGIELSDLLLRSLNQIPQTTPEQHLLAAHMAWYCEQVGYGAIYQGAAIHQLAMYNTPVAGKMPNMDLKGSYIFMEGGYCGLGTGQRGNDTLLVISNKAYYQSHAHYDENAIEMWVGGQKMLTNTGYPGYAHPGHTYAVSTEANNAVVIGGHPQYRIESDGFLEASFGGSIATLVSPCYLAYQHPAGFLEFPWLLMLAIIGLLAIAWVRVRTIPFVSDRKLAEKDSSSRSLFWSALFLHGAAFPLVVFRLYPYIMKGIQHMEAYPPVKAQFSAIFLYAILVLIVITALLSWFQLRKRTRLVKSIIPDNPEGYHRYLQISVIFYGILFTAYQWGVYTAIYSFAYGLFAQGSTVMHALEQILASFSLLVDIWAGLMGIRWWGQWRFFHWDVMIRARIKRDFLRWVTFLMFIVTGIFIMQSFGIENMSF